MWVLCLGQKDLLQKNTVSQSSILAWEISWGEEPGGLQSMEGQRVGHDLATEHRLCLHTLQLCRHISSLSEKARASHSSILAWKIPRTEEPGRLQSMGCRHDWVISQCVFQFTWNFGLVFSFSLLKFSLCSFPVIGKHFYDYFFEFLSGRLLISISLR